MNKNILKSALILTIIGLVCGLLISVANWITEPIIEQNKTKEARKAYKEFFPELDKVEIEEVDGTYVYEYVKVIDKSGNVVGHAFRTKGSNSRGLIDLLVAATPEGAIKGIKVLSYEHTPGYPEKYEGDDGFLDNDRVRGNTLDGLAGINNLAGATDTGSLLDRLIKEVGEVAHNYVVSVQLDAFETLFGIGATGTVVLEFGAEDVVREKLEVKDANNEFLGYAYKATTLVDEKALTVVVGMTIDGELKGVYEEEHTLDTKAYKDALNNLSGQMMANLEITIVAGNEAVGNALNTLFAAIRTTANPDIRTAYQKIFGEGHTGVVDEEFTATEIVIEKAAVYDAENNLVGYTYTGTILMDLHHYVPDKLLTIMVGVDTEGKVVGLIHLVNEHTLNHYENYYSALEALNGLAVENLNVESVTGSIISADALNAIFNAIKEVITNE